MKIKLSVSEERYEEVASELTSAGIELDEEADLLLTEREKHLRYLQARPAGRETDPSEKEHIPAGNIISIEAFGHNLEIRTTSGLYRQNDRLYRLQELLDPACFFRISNSTIINRRHIKKISPTFSMKFTLTMSDGSRADVTRSYYNSFKQFLGI